MLGTVPTNPILLSACMHLNAAGVLWVTRSVTRPRVSPKNKTKQKTIRALVEHGALSTSVPKDKSALVFTVFSTKIYFKYMYIYI